MSELSEEQIRMIAQLRKEGLNFEAIKRVTQIDKRTIKKYLHEEHLYVTLPHCQCKPGIYFIGCPFCETAIKDIGEEVFP